MCFEHDPVNGKRGVAKDSSGAADGHRVADLGLGHADILALSLGEHGLGAASHEPCMRCLVIVLVDKAPEAKLVRPELSQKSRLTNDGRTGHQPTYPIARRLPNIVGVELPDRRDPYDLAPIFIRSRPGTDSTAERGTIGRPSRGMAQ